MAKRKEAEEQTDQQAFDSALDIGRFEKSPRPNAPDDGKSDQDEARETKPEEKVEVAEKEAPKEEAPKVEEKVEPETKEEVTEPSETKEDETDEVTYTLPGGIKVKASELTGDPAQMQKVVSQANQVSHFQGLYEKEKAAREEEMAARQSLHDQWVAKQMEQEVAEQTPEAEPPPQQPRPSAEQIKGAFQPYLKSLHEQGRISEDQLMDDGGMISEYLFDQMVLRQTLEGTFQQYEERIQELESQLGPVSQNVQVQEALGYEQRVKNEVASTPGYEDFGDPGKWEQLKTYIGQRIAASGTDAHGEPNLRVVFDPPTMITWADGMMGPAMRQALAARQKEIESRRVVETQNAAGESSGVARRPAPEAEHEPTEHEMAMDFSGPGTAQHRKATG